MVQCLFCNAEMADALVSTADGLPPGLEFHLLKEAQQLELVKRGASVPCGRPGCKAVGVYCYLCAAYSVSSGWVCATHRTKCSGHKGLCAGRAAARWCSRCKSVYVLCRAGVAQLNEAKALCPESKPGAKRSERSPCALQDVAIPSGNSLVEKNEKKIKSIIVPIPPVAAVKCEAAAGSDEFKGAAFAMTSKWADWLENSASKYQVDAGHTTLCVSLFKHRTEERYTVLITHSSDHVGKVNSDPTKAPLSGDSGIVNLTRAFIATNLTEIAESLGVAGPGSRVVLPWSNPVVYLDRDSGTHFLCTRNKPWVAPEEDPSWTPAQKRATQFAARRQYNIEKDDSGAPGKYDIETNNAHHAEQKAVRWARDKWRLIAMSPTKGCCSKCQNTLTGGGLLGCVHPDRRDQSKPWK